MQWQRKWLAQLGAVILIIGLVTVRGVFLEERHDLDFSVKVQAYIIDSRECTQSAGRAGRGSSGIIFQPLISYRYQYASQTYVGNQVYRSQRYGFLTEDECAGFTKDLQRQKMVDAWIDPKHPEIAVLVPAKRGFALELLAVALGILMISTFALTNFFRRRG